MTNDDGNDDYWLQPQRQMAMITGTTSVTTIIAATTSGFGPSGKHLLASAPAAINNDVWLRPQWQTTMIMAIMTQARTIINDNDVNGSRNNDNDVCENERDDVWCEK